MSQGGTKAQLELRVKEAKEKEVKVNRVSREQVVFLEHPEIMV